MHKRNPSYATFRSFDKSRRELAPNFNYVQSQQQPHQQMVNHHQPNPYQAQPNGNQQPKFPNQQQRAPKQPHQHQPPPRQHTPPPQQAPRREATPMDFRIPQPEIGVNVFFSPEQQGHNLNRQPPQQPSQFPSQLYGDNSMGMRGNFSRNAVRR